MEEKDELIDFISDLIDKRVNEMFAMQLPQTQEIDMKNLIDRLEFDLRRAHNHAGYDMIIIDRQTGYSKILAIRGL